MFSKKHIFLIMGVCAVLIAGITIGAMSIVGGKKPTVESGSFENLIADRIEITVENTEFTLTKSKDSAEQFTLTLFLSAKKTQADFYAMINSFRLSSIAYDNIVFTALNSETEGKTLDSLLLPANNGEPETLKWQVDITLTVSGRGTYESAIMLDYTSGMNKHSAQQKIMEIPVIINVE